MTRGRPRPGLRRRLLLAVLGAVLGAVALLTAGSNLVLRDRLTTDQDRVLHASAHAQLGALRTVRGRLAVGEAPDDASVDSPAWIFARGRALERPAQAGAAVDAAARTLATGPTRSLSVSTPPTRLLAAPVVRAGRRLGTVVVAVGLAPYARTERDVLFGSLVLAAVVVLGAGLIARWLLAAAFRPVARMTADAADWSEHDLDQRFGLGNPRDEITDLAATLDGLLGRVAAAVRRERRFSAELSHELRTPLAKIASRAQLLGAEPGLPDPLRVEVLAIRRTAGEMNDVIEGLMSAARAEGPSAAGRADAVQAADAALAAARPLAAARGVELTREGSGPLLVAAEPSLVERLLAPVLENAGRMARTHGCVTLAAREGRVELCVQDDGPGVSPADAERIFEPGVRVASADDHDGAGLGLALARRLARSAGGEIRAEPAEGGRFVITLPQS